MTEIQTNFFNFSEAELLSQILPNSKDYEFTADKIFRRRISPVCTCGCKCVYNGYNIVRKKHFGKAKIGKYLCPKCRKNYAEDKKHWKDILAQWKDTVISLFSILRYAHVAYRVISNIMAFILPYKKDNIYAMFNNKIKRYNYSINEAITIIHYDEQHPKRGRNQKFRLTLLMPDGRVLADELYEDKKKETIKDFLLNHLDLDKEITIVTDCDTGYPAIFKEIWGNRIRQQKCLLHLNKLICKDLGKNTSLLNEYNKYLLLNIFYNRSSELKKLERLMVKMEKIEFKTNKEKWIWICEAKKDFWDYVKKRENRRRKKGKNLTQRTIKKAEENFAKILSQKCLFPKKLQKRIEMIEKNWDCLTTFYEVKGCLATNNAIENFYSTSLKTHRKNQFRTDVGLKNQMKVAAFKRDNGFEVRETLTQILHKICLLAT